MKGDLWTMAMHQPVDTRELDRLGRNIVRCAVIYHEVFFHKDRQHTERHKHLLEAIGFYREQLQRMVLEEPEIE
jgi:hypothetical protein